MSSGCSIPPRAGPSAVSPQDKTAGTRCWSRTKPQLAGRLLQHAHEQGVRAGFVAGDEVYGGRDLRRSIRERGTGYVLAVRSSYPVTLSCSRRLSVKKAASLVKPGMWQRMRTGAAPKGAKDYDWAMIEILPDDTPEGQ